MSSETEYDAILHNWRKLSGTVRQYSGDVYSDEKHRFNNGTRVVTSPGNINDGILRTKNTRYLLAAPR